MLGQEEPRLGTSLLGIVLLAAAAVFVADILIPLGVAGGVPYVAVILLAALLNMGQREIVLVAILCSVLTVLGLWFSPLAGGTESWKVLANRALALFAIATVAGFVVQRNRAEDQQRLLATVLADSNDAVFLHDLKGRIALWNRGAEKMYGYTAKEAASLNAYDLGGSERRTEMVELVQRLQTCNGAVSLETQRQTKQGRTVEIWLTLTKIVDRQGKLIGVARTERDLRRVETIGKTAATIAHELRNPLSGIHNAVHYLQRIVPAEQPQWQQYLDLINQEVLAADQVICNVLSLVRNRDSVKSPNDLEKSIARAWQQTAISEQVELQSHLEPSPFWVFADANQLEQILGNLFVNAAQAMEGHGFVTVEAHHQHEYDSIVVRDQGPGIRGELQERIFQTLFTTKTKGVGLGLSICRQLIEGHGGTIRVLDTENNGRGGAFEIRLPQASPLASEEAPQEQEGSCCRTRGGL